MSENLLNLEKYYKVEDKERLEELRKLADSLTHLDLITLVSLYALRCLQQGNMDRIESGEDIDQIPNTPEQLQEAAASFIDTITSFDELFAVMRANKLAKDYVLEIRPRYVVIPKV